VIALTRTSALSQVEASAVVQCAAARRASSRILTVVRSAWRSGPGAVDLSCIKSVLKRSSCLHFYIEYLEFELNIFIIRLAASSYSSSSLLPFSSYTLHIISSRPRLILPLSQSVSLSTFVSLPVSLLADAAGRESYPASSRCGCSSRLASTSRCAARQETTPACSAAAAAAAAAPTLRPLHTPLQS
jgi:hypothetical protein